MYVHKLQWSVFAVTLLLSWTRSLDVLNLFTAPYSFITCPFGSRFPHLHNLCCTYLFKLRFYPPSLHPSINLAFVTPSSLGSFTPIGMNILADLMLLSLLDHIWETNCGTECLGCALCLRYSWVGKSFCLFELLCSVQCHRTISSSVLNYLLVWVLKIDFYNLF